MASAGLLMRPTYVHTSLSGSASGPPCDWGRLRQSPVKDFGFEAQQGAAAVGHGIQPLSFEWWSLDEAAL